MAQTPASCDRCRRWTRDYYRRSPETGRKIKAAICAECYEVALARAQSRLFDDEDAITFARRKAECR